MPDRHSKRIGLLAGAFLLLFAANVCSAQEHEEIQYYISPYWHAVQIDPIGTLLDRISARYEFRVDPLLSRYFEFAYQRNLNTKVTNDVRTPSASAAFGERIFLRDNAAMIGLFAGVNVGIALLDHRTVSARITLEIGYKLPLGKNSHFFIEPEGLIDSYIIKRPNMRQIFPYLAIPFGYIW
jgi:hypothetical protein